MKNTLTIKEALEQGYEYYLYPNTGWQSLKYISDAQQDEFDDDPDKEIVLASKEPLNPLGMSSEEIAETLADIISDNHYSNTGCDDTDEVYDAIKNLDFNDASNKISEALKSIKYRMETKIRLIP